MKFGVYGLFEPFIPPQFISLLSVGWFTVSLTICLCLKIDPAKLASPGIPPSYFGRSHPAATIDDIMKTYKAITIQSPVAPIIACASPAVAKPAAVVIKPGRAKPFIFGRLFLPEKNHLVGPLRAFLDLRPPSAASLLGDNAIHSPQA